MNLHGKNCFEFLPTKLTSYMYVKTLIILCSYLSGKGIQIVVVAHNFVSLVFILATRSLTRLVPCLLDDF